MPPNVRYIGHVPTAEHNVLNCSARTVLNINRASMANSGFSPPTRVFEAAGAAACMLCDDWPGLYDCFQPDQEILVARCRRDPTHRRSLPPPRSARPHLCATRRAGRRGDPLPDEQARTPALTAVRAPRYTHAIFMTASMYRLLLRFVLLLTVCLACGSTIVAEETAAEHLADRAAQAELRESPRDGNIRSYRLAPADLLKAGHLEHTRNILQLGGTVWGIVSLYLLLHFGVIGRMQRFVTGRFRNRWAQGYLFLLLFMLATTLLSLPLDLYDQALRRRYGLSVQSWLSWFGDQGKGFALGWGDRGLLVMLLFLILRRAPRRWWFVFWCLFIPISLAGIFATPYIIDPLFNHFEPLNASHPELVQRLEQVAQRGHMNIPPERMFLMKASEKSTTLNAYVTGFGASKRVVVWDTSIAKGTPDQILFIFAHESGHYVLHHILRGVAEGLLGTLLLLYLGFRLVQPLLHRYGARWGLTDQTQWGALAVLLLIASVLGAVMQPISEAMSRSKEHAADEYGQEAIHGLVSNPQESARGAFQILGETSYDDPNPSPLVEWWTYSHPAIGRRAAFAAHYEPWQPGLRSDSGFYRSHAISVRVC